MSKPEWATQLGGWDTHDMESWLVTYGVVAREPVQDAYCCKRCGVFAVKVSILAPVYMMDINQPYRSTDSITCDEVIMRDALE